MKLGKQTIAIMLSFLPLFLISPLYIGGGEQSVSKQREEQRAIFQQYVSREDKDLIQSYIENGADITGSVSHTKETGILMLWGGNKNSGIIINDLYQYEGKLSGAMRNLGFNMLSPMDSPSSIILVYRNGVKMMEYGPRKIDGYRSDLHFVYFDLEKDQIVKLGIIEGKALPSSIRIRPSSKLTTYFGDEASYEDQIQFLLKNLSN